MSFLTNRQVEMIEEITTLLDEAYDHYFEFSDGYCKSSEGYVEIRLPTYFGRSKDNNWLNAREGVELGVYSYVLGPSRMHYFDTIEEALETVREWHDAEMEATYEENWL